MGTTARERPTSARRARASAREDRELDPIEGAEDTYDLLTAAVLGLAIGVGATLLLRQGPRGRRPITPVLRGVGQGARWAGDRTARGAKWTGSRVAEGADWTRDRAGDLWDRVPVEDIRDRLGDYLEAAQDAIQDTVESELKDLRKSIRRQRKRLGL